MKAKHAGHIRYGIQLARMSPDDKAGPLGSILLPRLTIRAYIREDARVLRRMLHPTARCTQPVSTDREESTGNG